MPAISRLFNPYFFWPVLVLFTATRASATLPVLSDDELSWLSEQIFRNECNAEPSCLTSWNRGEDFPSLGLGHFIWFQAGQTEVFTETFPQLLDFYRDEGHDLPAWLERLPSPDSPWADRESFQRDLDGAELTALRKFLFDTRLVQTAFIMRRLERALPRILAAAPPDQGQSVEELFYTLANSHSPYGIYALVDYVNFKGEGISREERYQGEGWGLLQVLQTMLENDEPGNLPQFVDAAASILTRRVANAPADRNEQRWLQGWFNRLDTYLPL
ncbi:MAG: hypothetical protein WDZ76_04270 [Pseudohongiellaceae bacterium]